MRTQAHGQKRPAGKPGPRPASPSRSNEDYLERIGELIERKGRARVGEIAAALGIRQPSVTAMAQKLAAAGYLEYERYRELRLTPRGLEVARAIRERHALLQRFFTLMALPAAVQERDIEGLEHSLSPETLRCLGDIVEHYETDARAFRAFQEFRRHRGR